MATVELTLEQLRDAIVQLPKPQRRKLFAEVERLSPAEEAREAARRIRGTFRLNAHQREHMADLLAKENEGTLTAKQLSGNNLSNLVYFAMAPSWWIEIPL